MANHPTTAVVVGIIVALVFLHRASASTFTLINSCDYTVWPGILAGAGTSPLSTTGFELSAGESRAVDAPEGWSGRLWGRTLCTFDADGHGKCATGDCGGSLECKGNNAAPPATLAEFTLGKDTLPDFYDVSLVDGYNLPMIVAAKGGTGTCSTTGCVTDLNLSCPKELQVDTDGTSSVACKSACEAFQSPEYCCSGAYGNPNTCRPSSYSVVFKAACPKAYSYAYDDATSTFTCTAADYVITFCPTVTSQKKSDDPSNSVVNGTDTWGISTFASTNQAVAATSYRALFAPLSLGLLGVWLLMQ
uniref:Thaumatin-like protein n=1 Tax=Araucaria cunninghamii TaxID=56994 RepID=A0A0D6R3R4_ARACU